MAVACEGLLDLKLPTQTEMLSCSPGGLVWPHGAGLPMMTIVVFVAWHLMAVVQTARYQGMTVL